MCICVNEAIFLQGLCEAPRGFAKLLVYMGFMKPPGTLQSPFSIVASQSFSKAPSGFEKFHLYRGFVKHLSALQSHVTMCFVKHPWNCGKILKCTYVCMKPLGTLQSPFGIWFLQRPLSVKAL